MRVLALAGLSTTLLGTAVAEIESEFHVGYSSDYIFRGADLGGDLYEFGLDFAGSGDVQGLGAFDWSAGVWYASIDANGGAANSSTNELDVYGGVSKSLNDMFAVAVGITNYSYFGNGAAGGTNDDIEPYVSIGAEVAGISLGAAAHFDGANNYAHDLYYEFTASYERELGENLSGGIELVLGYFDDSNAVPGDDSDVFFGGTASLSYAVSDNITVSPYASLTFSDNLGDHFFGGVSVGFGF